MKLNLKYIDVVEQTMDCPLEIGQEIFIVDRKHFTKKSIKIRSLKSLYHNEIIINSNRNLFIHFLIKDDKMRFNDDYFYKGAINGAYSSHLIFLNEQFADKVISKNKGHKNDQYQ